MGIQPLSSDGSTGSPMESKLIPRGVLSVEATLSQCVHSLSTCSQLKPSILVASHLSLQFSSRRETIADFYSVRC